MEILRAIPTEVIDAKHAAIDKVWRSVAWPDPPHPQDAFHAVLGEIGRKKRELRRSPCGTINNAKYIRAAILYVRHVHSQFG